MTTGRANRPNQWDKGTMATALKDPRIQLSDQRLFREQCYVDGQWIAADDGKTIKVTDPANGETIGTVPGVGVRRRPVVRSRRPSGRCRPGGPRPRRSAAPSCASGSSW